jgi:hypothetical protein
MENKINEKNESGIMISSKLREELFRPDYYLKEREWNEKIFKRAYLSFIN